MHADKTKIYKFCFLSVYNLFKITVCVTANIKMTRQQIKVVPKNSNVIYANY